MNPPHHLQPPYSNINFFPPSPSFNPNPNPNFNPTFIVPALPPAKSIGTQPEFSDTPLPDLSTSLSLLTNLLDLANSTLLSLSSLISQHPLSLSSEGFSRCPFNPNHLMPPASLFLHSLHCPSPIHEDVRSLLDALHYPKTLKPEPQLTEQHKFVNPLHDPSSELCFSLDDYVEFGSNFFYQDCPGVVSLSSGDAAKRIFSLPGVLSVECANFASGTDAATHDSFRLLPSELWVVKSEIEQWIDFPNVYSYTMLRALLCVETAKQSDLMIWVIANSPYYGIIIDSPMRDHIFVLFRLCVKAIVREAHRSYQPLLVENLDKTEGNLNPKPMGFSCPTLVNVLSWLATQLSVLYGEANANLFTIGMLKQLLQNVASSSLVYPLDQSFDKVLDTKQSSVISAGNLIVDQFPGQVGEKKADSSVSRGVVSGAVYVYQVAVAIAALHERSLLEDKIKFLRNSQYVTAYQRLAEHDYLSKKAEDERQKRPNYRPLVEHDGLPVQRHDKDMNDRNKTKEQLLAEERDYKRRRMSYRGKKAKRNVKEVMRDIIEEHMDAIREAGGIGCFDKCIEDGSVSTSKPLAQEYDKSMEFNRNTSYDYEPNRNHRNVYNINSDYNSQTMEPAEHARDRKVSGWSRHRDDSYTSSPGRERNREGSRDQRNLRRKETYPPDSYPRSPSRERKYKSYRDKMSESKKETEEDDSYHSNPGAGKKYGQSKLEKSDGKLEGDDDSYRRSPSIDRHGRLTDDRSSWRNESADIYKSRSTSHGNKSSSRSYSAVHSGRKDKRRIEDSDRERRKRVRNERSNSITGSEFNDRYAPSGSP